MRDWATFALGTLAPQDTAELRDALAARLDDPEPRRGWRPSTASRCAATRARSSRRWSCWPRRPARGRRHGAAVWKRCALEATQRLAAQTGDARFEPYLPALDERLGGHVGGPERRRRRRRSRRGAAPAEPGPGRPGTGGRRRRRGVGAAAGATAGAGAGAASGRGRCGGCGRRPARARRAGRSGAGVGSGVDVLGLGGGRARVAGAGGRRLGVLVGVGAGVGRRPASAGVGSTGRGGLLGAGAGALRARPGRAGSSARGGGLVAGRRRLGVGVVLGQRGPGASSGSTGAGRLARAGVGAGEARPRWGRRRRRCRRRRRGCRRCSESAAYGFECRRDLDRVRDAVAVGVLVAVVDAVAVGSAPFGGGAQAELGDVCRGRRRRCRAGVVGVSGRGRGRSYSSGMLSPSLSSGAVAKPGSCGRRGRRAAAGAGRRRGGRAGRAPAGGAGGRPRCGAGRPPEAPAASDAVGRRAAPAGGTAVARRGRVRARAVAERGSSGSRSRAIAPAAQSFQPTSGTASAPSRARRRPGRRRRCRRTAGRDGASAWDAGRRRVPFRMTGDMRECPFRDSASDEVRLDYRRPEPLDESDAWRFRPDAQLDAGLAARGQTDRAAIAARAVRLRGPAPRVRAGRLGRPGAARRGGRPASTRATARSPPSSPTGPSSAARRSTT